MKVNESQARDSPKDLQSPLVPRCPIMYPLIRVIVLERVQNEATFSDVTFSDVFQASG
jgi:hypothetical protein